MKSTWFACRQRYEFARLLHDADYSQQHYDTFRSFLSIAYQSFRQAIAWCPAREERICAERSRVSKPALLGQALACLTLALEEDAYDFLGMVMQELEINDKSYKGQCFTPRAVSRCMAEVALADAKPDPSRTMTLQEPACGGGSMVIAASGVLKEKGFGPRDFCWQAIDLDPRCFQMTFIQTTLCCIPCHCVNGNTLSLEVFEESRNLPMLMFPPRRTVGASD